MERKPQREGGSVQDRGRGRREGSLFHPPSLKTHLGPMHAQLKTSLRHLSGVLNAAIVVVLLHPISFFFAFRSISPLPPRIQCPSTSFVRPPRLLYNWKKLSQKMTCTEAQRWFAASATGISQARSTQGFCRATCLR